MSNFIYSNSTETFLVPTDASDDARKAYVDAVLSMVQAYGVPFKQAASDAMTLSNGATLSSWAVLQWSLPPVDGERRFTQLVYRGSDDSVHVCMLRATAEGKRLLREDH